LPTAVPTSTNNIITVTANWNTTGGTESPPPPPPAGQYQLRVVGAGAGGSQTGNYMPGASVTLNAGTAPAGSTFVNWTISPTTVSLTSATSATAAQVTIPSAAPTTTNNIITVTANWNTTGGSTGGGGSGSGSGSDEFTVITHFGTWTGSGTKEAKIDADHTKFVRLTKSGTAIPASNYTVAQGSTLITLTEAYLTTLADGNHTFRAEFSDGHANINLIISRGFGNVPQTGVADITWKVVLMWVSIILTVALCISMYFYKKEMRKRKEYGSRYGK